MGKILFIIRNLNYNTIIFNFKHFPFSVARKLPVFLHKKAFLKNTSGSVKLPASIFTGMIRIGFGDVGIFDQSRSRTIWEVKGLIEFKGSANIGHGSRICVGSAGNLVIGDAFNITAESSIICYHNISFGNNCLLSWEILMMDTDFHTISRNGLIINEDKPILIGDKVWLGARCSILKGAIIPSGCVVAAGALVS